MPFSEYRTNSEGMANISHLRFCSESRVFVRPSDVGLNVLCCESLRLDIALSFFGTRGGWPPAFLKVSSITDSTAERNKEESNNISV